jgi:DNA-directed RNA polymerase specialized sigma24 family protein
VVKALVSAAAAAATLRGYADRAHDAARRLGCTETEATEAARDAAIALIQDLERRPETVRDLVGGLFARVRDRALAARHSREYRPAAAPMAPQPSDDAPTAALRSAAQSAAVDAALASLSDDERFCLLVRDSYGLTVHQAGVAIGVDPLEAARAVALARLALVAALEQADPITLAGHDTAVGDLGQLADGSAPAGGRFAALRRHVSGCALCASVLDAQTRAAAMLSALPVLALPDAPRRELLDHGEHLAAAALPTEEQVRIELDEGSVRRPLVPLWLVVGLVAAGCLVGVAIGSLLAHHDDGPTSSVHVTTTATGSASAAPSVSAPASRTTPAPPTPSASRSTPPAVTTTVHSSDPAPSASSVPPTSAVGHPGAVASTTVATSAPELSLSPTSGPFQSTVLVTGAGFPADASIQVEYVNSHGTVFWATTVPVHADASGSFQVQARARGGGLIVSEPGTYVFSASGGGVTATATFEQNS